MYLDFPESTPPPRKRFPRPLVIALAVIAVIFLAWLFWPVNFKILVKNNPTQTRLMELRQQQAKKRKQPYRLHYTWVPLRRIAQPLQQAVIAAEDDVFYKHHGVDFDAIRVSLKNNWKTKAYSQGGSTITQQVVKNLYLSPRKSLFRKLREAVLAFAMERTLSKKRIFEIYLNIAEWGRGIFGAEAAAQHFFGKSAAELSAEEAVALVAVLPSPIKHSPIKEDRFLKWRKTWVWRQLRYAGYYPKDAVPNPPESEPDWMTEEINDDGETVVPDAQTNSLAADSLAPELLLTPGPENEESTLVEPETDKTLPEPENQPLATPAVNPEE